MANLQAIHAALDSARITRRRIFYAMKANRFMPLLTAFAQSGLCGIDVCSPSEMLHALACGFSEEDISYTGTSVSEADLDILCRHPGIMINCDSQSAMRRLAARKVFNKIGVRINPAIGTGYGDSQLLSYSGDKSTKFGIYLEQFDETLALADQLGLSLVRIHFHTGCGYLDRQLAVWERILETCCTFIDRLPNLEAINIGGGLGVRHKESDGTLDLSQWAEIIRRRLGKYNCEIQVEPGDRIIKDAGVLVLRANTVEYKKDTLFVGVDGGFNHACEPVYYGMPCEPVPALLGDSKAKVFAPSALIPTTLAGNINEALDVWCKGYPLPAFCEDDLVVLLNAGGYASAMSSNHCMRGEQYERLLLQKTI
jgi:diaminopimelate decarboxylase